MVGGAGTILPHWAAAVQKLILVQPSSAAAERVFSLLKASSSERQDHALQDYFETSFELQYNNGDIVRVLVACSNEPKKTSLSITANWL